MHCIDTGAIAFMFNGGSSCASTIHPMTHILLILSTFFLPECMNHELYRHLCFLAPQVYLCSASLKLGTNSKDICTLRHDLLTRCLSIVDLEDNISAMTVAYFMVNEQDFGNS